MDLLVQPLNRVIQVQPGANLLKALQDAQVSMSYSCMAGPLRHLPLPGARR